MLVQSPSSLNGVRQRQPVAAAWTSCTFGVCLLLLGCERDNAAPDAATQSQPQTRRPLDNFARSWHRRTQAGAGASPDAATDAGEPHARGEYLVRHVAGCMECHTPRLASGAFDESRLLSGVEDLLDLEPEEAARGALHSRNLTPDDKTGLGRFSDEQIKKAFQQGIDDESTVLHWMMPYWIYRNMTSSDADAIVAFLRSIPPIVHDVPDSQPNAVELQKPYEPYHLPIEELPHPALAADRDSTERGRYLATSATPCLLCHTPASKDPARPIDPSLAFTGRRRFVPVRLGTTQGLDADVPEIESYNLTPHANGLGGWTALDVANVLRFGAGRDSLPVCDPMPSSFGGSFTGMTENDALDLGQYFISLPPKDTGKIPVCCTACHRRNTGDDAGGLEDAGL